MSDNVLGCILLYISCTIASAGGIGGGGLNVPIFLVIFKFSYEKSVVLSLATVFGNYLIQVIINWRKVHPFNNSRPLIYWEAVLCLLPAQLGGSNIGVIISKILPDTLLLYLALLILIYAFVKTVKKAIYPPLGLVVYYGTRYVAEQQKKFPEFVVAGDIDFSTMGFIPAICAFIIGILCSLLGIGGGELMGPLLLQLKVIPQVSSATTSLMSLFNSSSNVLHYAIIGEIPYILAVSVFAIGILGGEQNIQIHSFC
eukprot:gene17316-22857_t